MPALIYLDLAVKLYFSPDIVSWQDLCVPWAFLRLPLTFFATTLIHSYFKNEPVGVSEAFKLSILSLVFTFAATIGLAVVAVVLSELLTAFSIDLDLSLLNFFRPAVEIWIVSGIIWPLSFYSTVLSFPSNPVQTLTAFISLGFLTWLSVFSSSKISHILTKKIKSQNRYLMGIENPDIMITYPEPSESPSQLTNENLGKEETEVFDREICEEPKPLKPFHAVDGAIARKAAASRGLLVLWKEYDKTDLYARKRVYWAIPPSFAAKLLRCQIDMKHADEFNAEERRILEDLIAKRWIKKFESDGVFYYYGLNRRTADILTKQIQVKKLKTNGIGSARR